MELKFDPRREEAELRTYLGEAFDETKLYEHLRFLDAEAEEVGDEATFYRTSNAYLYDLTLFAMTGIKLPYLELLTERVAPGSRVLDYGCGIGSDGLLLLEAGYRVEFADFANPSTQYLRWRLERRGFEAPVHDLDVHVPAGFNIAYSFDVIEHVTDPFSFLDELESRAELVEVNFLEFDPNEQLLHYELPIGRLLRRVVSRELIDYRILHGSSHLVLYRTRPASGARRFGSAAVLAAGAARHQLGRLRKR